MNIKITLNKSFKQISDFFFPKASKKPTTKRIDYQ
jgi:hypothetical protein